MADLPSDQTARSEPSPDDLREQGNTLYKARKFHKAIDCYSQASELDRNDPRPLANLSAVHYELGNYKEAMDYAVRSYHLSIPGDARLEKLGIRYAKSALYLRDWASFQNAVQRLTPGILSSNSISGLKQEHVDRLSTEDAKEYWQKVVHFLPKNLPLMHEEYPHMNFGHDFAHWQLDAPIYQGLEVHEPASILFGGIGDARHLFMTLLVPELLIRNLHQSHGMTDDTEPEYVTEKYRHRPINVTCSDIKPAVIARLFLFLFIMGKLGELESNTSPDSDHDYEVQMLTSLLMYLSLGSIMPPSVFDRFQQTVELAIRILEGKAPQPHKWLYVYEKDVPTLTKQLRMWQRPAPKKWTTPDVRKMASKHKWSEMDVIVLPKLRDEAMLWEQTGVILPPPQILEKHEPLLFAHSKDLAATARSKKAVADIIKHVDAKWKPNLTIPDPQEIESRRDIRIGCFNWHPYDYLPRRFGKIDIPQGSRLHLYDWAHEAAYGSYARMIYTHSPRLRIELTLADVFEQLEEIQHIGTFSHRNSKELSGKDVTSLPQKYNRIHLSNIPDYIGGPLPTLMHATGASRVDRPSSHITFNIMFEKSCFNPRDLSLDGYFRQHVGFSVDSPGFEALTNAVKIEKPVQPWQEEGYEHLIYQHFQAKETSQIPLNKLLKQTELETWFYDYFFSIAFPYPHDIFDRPTLVVSSLNLAFVFRLMIHLHGVGYPAHWLAAILTPLLSGKIKTQARPPKTHPRLRSKKHAQGPMREITIFPFIQELRTLATLFNPIMPFAYPNAGPIVKRDDIFRLKLEFGNNVRTTPDACPHYFLMIVDSDAFVESGWGPGGAQPSFRKLLLDDETGYPDGQSTRVRDHGSIIITTFKFEGLRGDKASGVSFWFSKKRLQRMLNGGWILQLMRNDDWSIHGMATISSLRSKKIEESWSEASP